MKKYIVRTGEGAAFNAASKARRDADVIALGLGYEPFPFRGARTADGSLTGAVRLALAGLSNWRRLMREAERGSLVLIQYPHYPMKSAFLARRMLPRARCKGLRFIALVHDLDGLRGLHGAAARYSDAKLLPLFDAVICHNEAMAEHLAAQGIPRDRLIPLGLFDYLTDAEPPAHRREDGVAIAGNLSPEKCGYVRELIRTAPGDLPIHLYGKGLEAEALPKNVHAHGAFPPETLPGALEGGFGLVWDGQETHTCAGQAGEYLRVNNPHKLSLYMAAGLPAVVWRESALAEYVQAHGVGIAVNSLKDLRGALDGVSDGQYAEMLENAEAMGKKIRRGAYLALALRQAENRMETH